MADTTRTQPLIDPDTTQADTYVPLSGHATTNQQPRRVNGLELGFVILLLVGSGSINFVLLKVLYSAYGERNAFFVSQGVNFLYVAYGAVITYPRLLGWGIGNRVSAALGMDPITRSMRRSPQRRFVVMGLLDCFGTFCTAMGAVHTPGQYQPLLNQSLVPCTMVVSFLLLRTRYKWTHTLGALLIVGGAVFSIVPSLTGNSNDVKLYAVIVYWLSNVPMACSAVYKEARFNDEQMDVCWLTQFVSIYQLLFGFVLAPLQVIPGVGTARGISLQQIADSFVGGARCFVQSPGSGCEGRDTALLIFGYVGVNFFFNTVGLWLTKHGGAVLNSMCYALLLPLTTIFFSFPFLGPYREALHWTTFGGLVFVLVGFCCWRYSDLSSSSEGTSPDPAALPSFAADAGKASEAMAQRVRGSSGGGVPDGAADTSSRGAPSSFQERVIGMGLAHRMRAGRAHEHTHTPSLPTSWSALPTSGSDPNLSHGVSSRAVVDPYGRSY